MSRGVKPEGHLDAKLIVSLALLATAWASAGLAPARDTVEGALHPVDFARDYVAAHMRVHEGRGVAPVGEAGNDYAATIGAPRVVLLGGPYFIHPPPALLVILPLVPLGFGGAAIAWLVLSLLALGVLAFFLVETAGLDERRPALRVALLALVLLVWPPVLHNLSKGQWSLLLAALIAAGVRALLHGRPRTAGIFLGLAASIKVTPILLLCYLALRHRRAALAMVATLATAGCLSIAANGWEPWRAWFADAPRDVAAWQTWMANTVSLGGALGRLFAGGPFALALVPAPGVARALTVALSIALVAAASFVTLRAPPTPQIERNLLASWLSLVVVLNPLAWTHTAAIALLPLALLAWASAATIPTAALIVLTIPRETLAALAGPTPVRPLPGLVLSLHAAAVLVLFVFGLSVSAAGSKGRPGL